MKILITGGSGMLGSALKEEACRLNFLSKEFDRNLVFQVPVTAVAAKIAGSDLFIHAAANTSVEKCELDPDRCYRDNLLLTELLARACSLAGVPFLFISSTGVYGTGKQVAYKEYDAVSPTTHYHNSKHLAEKLVFNLSSKNLVLRTGWIFGGEIENPKNFVARRIDEAKEALRNHSDLKSNSQQWGVPCYSRDIAVRALLLAREGHSGLFNCVNTGFASRFDYVSAILRVANINITISKSDAANFGRKAIVSNNEMAENWKMDSLGISRMPHWEESLMEYIRIIINKI